MRFKQFYLTEVKDLEDIKQDDEHDFERCDGVTYRLSGKNEKIVNVSEVTFTPGNTFYNTRVNEYVKYIEDGGIIDSFPVRKLRLANNLYDMCKFLYNHYGADDYYEHEAELSIFKSKFFDNIVPDLTDMFDPKSEHFVPGLNKKATNTNNLFEDKNLEKEFEHKKDFQLIFDFFDENFEYNLTEMNHRFKAIKKLEIESVYVDIVNK